MEQGFELLGQEPDIRMKVSGKTLEHLFRNALRGLAVSMHPGAARSAPKTAKEAVPIRAEAVDIHTLLVEFLSQAISHSDMNGMVFLDVSFDEFGENFLSGNLKGIAVDGIERPVRGVAYEDLDIKKNSDTGLYEAVLVIEA